MNTVVELPEGAPGDSCDATELVSQIERSGRDYIVIGAQQFALAKHSKPHSLDYWLRVNCTARSDTMQATRALVDRLVGTGLLFRDKMIDPNTGRRVNCLRLSSAR